MFGYVVVNKPELKIREFAEYKGYYCGLCHMLREKYGLSAGLTLTYDMTFLIVLLDSLYEPARETKKRHCPIHPVRKVPMIRNSITEYAADMNILLSHGHLRDNWEDERRVSGLMGDLCFRRRARFCIEKYPRQAKAVTDSLKKLSNIEKTYMYHWTESEMGEEWRMKLGGDVNAGLTADIDEISRPFGELMSELFMWKEDAFAPTMRRFGFFLGKYIYIRDALDDLEKDRKNKCFNPFLHEKTDDAFRSRTQAMLDVILRQAIAEFEKLPLERNLAILRNILYEGVRREKTPTKADRLDKSRTVG